MDGFDPVHFILLFFYCNGWIEWIFLWMD